MSGAGVAGDLPGERVVFVHAHPDDETLGTGGTLAHCVAQGRQVTLVTCTRGEQGEVIGADLAHLAADRDDALGPHRERELAAAMRALGVADHRFLDAGTPRRYRDSGMALDAAGRVVLPDDVRPDAFVLADPEVAAADLAAVLDAVRADVVVTYDPGGGYGHPDHVRAHEIATRAAGRVGATVFWSVTPASVFAADQALLDSAANPFGPRSPHPPSMVCPDGDVDVRLDVRPYLAAKAAALRAHATQVQVAAPFFALSNDVGQVIADAEHFRRAPR